MLYRGNRYHSEMGYASELARKDDAFVQIVDAAFAEVAMRSGVHLACRVGCSQCCRGAFAIDQLDALRLRRGMAELTRSDPPRAALVEARAREYVERLGDEFPGDAASGVLCDDPDSMERFAGFANDEPCPALDPQTGACDLYAWRPLTCRVFGAPVRSEQGLGVCELCFTSATSEEIAACELHVDPDDLGVCLEQDAERLSGTAGVTVVAWALLQGGEKS